MTSKSIHPTEAAPATVMKIGLCSRVYIGHWEEAT